jgi:hypothetical protein
MKNSILKNKMRIYPPAKRTRFCLEGELAGIDSSLHVNILYSAYNTGPYSELVAVFLTEQNDYLRTTVDLVFYTRVLGQ